MSNEENKKLQSASAEETNKKIQPLDDDEIEAASGGSFGVNTNSEAVFGDKPKQDTAQNPDNSVVESHSLDTN